MKKGYVLVLIATLLIVLCGCSNNDNNENTLNINDNDLYQYLNNKNNYVANVDCCADESNRRIEYIEVCLRNNVRYMLECERQQVILSDYETINNWLKKQHIAYKVKINFKYINNIGHNYILEMDSDGN